MKKNVKVVVAALFCALCAGVAFAEDYSYQALYWQVDGDSLWPYEGVTYANLYATVEGDSVRVGTYPVEIADAIGGQKTDFVGGDSEGLWDWGSYDVSSATFYVELWNDFAESEDPTVIATSYGASYASLVSSMERTPAGSSDPYPATTVASFYFPIPEPTSAMLWLLGVAGLALRRRRA